MSVSQRLKKIEEHYQARQRPTTKKQRTEEEQRIHEANLVLIFESLHPEHQLMVIEDIGYYVLRDQPGMEEWGRLGRQAKARALVAYWQNQSGEHTEPRLECFTRYDIWSHEFERVTQWVSDCLWEIDLQVARERALNFLLLSPHNLQFYLWDYHLEHLEAAVQATGHTSYLPREDYERMLPIRAEVAARQAAGNGQR